jgi:hypothetical protein
LFIRFLINGITKELTILEPHYFTGLYVLNESNVISSMQDEEQGRWYMEVRFHTTEKKIVAGIEVHIKATSDVSECIDHLKITTSKTGQLLFGDVVHVKTIAESDDEEETEYEMPKPISNGPDNENEEYSENLSSRSVRERKIDDIASPAIISKSKDVFERSTLDIKWNPEKNVEINQDSYAKNGVFNSYFTIKNVELENTLGSEYKVIKTECFWKNRNGEWIFSDFRLGKTENNQIIWQDKGTAFSIDKLQKHKLCVLLTIPTIGEPGYDFPSRRRIPAAFPKPLNVKFTFTNESFSLIDHLCVIKNEPLTWPTKESVEKEILTKCHFVYCDNTKDESRDYIAVYTKENLINVKFSGGSTWFLSPTEIKSIGFNALESNQNEYYMKHWTKSDNRNNESKTFALVDKNGKVYGFKFEMKSSTSSKTEWVKLPKLVKPKKNLLPYSVVVEETEYHLNDEVFVHWNVSNHLISNKDYLAIYSDDEMDVKSYVKYSFNSYSNKNGVLTFPVDGHYLKIGGKYHAKYVSKDNVVLATSSSFSVV